MSSFPMPEFISKLQHNTYEKGEFSEEKPRTLYETLDLIKNFPWDGERTLTDIQLTGPSVTIQNEYINYLKVGLFFNGKYCLYYLDNNNHLYEYHAETLTDVFSMITDFFNQEIKLEKFDKHLFNIGNQPHFVTSYFEYRVTLARIFKLTIFIDLYFVMFSFLFLGVGEKNDYKPDSLFLLFPVLLIGGLLAFILVKAFVSRGMYLQISKGNDVFSFGTTEDSVKTYNKSNVQQIVAYENRGSKNPNLVEVFEIEFKNGESIKLSNFLISGSTLYQKFSDKMGNVTIPVIRANRSSLREL